MTPKKVILVDDKPVYRNAMKTLLKRLGDVDIIAEAANGNEFLSLLDNYAPDIVFMDIEMPEMNGIEATRRALEKKPELTIIGLSMYDNDAYVDELIKAGAKGYLLKLSDNSRIFKSILEYHRAEMFFSKEIDYQPKVDNGKKKTILIVDDFEANTFAVGFALSNAGYNVIKAHSGAEALQYARANKVDLIITDYKMPVMNGVELIYELKQMADYEAIPTLVLSSEKGEKEKKDAKEAGVTAWIEKPFILKKFLQTVEKALT